MRVRVRVRARASEGAKVRRCECGRRRSVGMGYLGIVHSHGHVPGVSDPRIWSATGRVGSSGRTLAEHDATTRQSL